MSTTIINIPQPNIIVVHAELRGVEPGLILNPFGRKAEAALLGSMQKSKPKLRSDKDPDKEYKERLQEVTIDKKKDLYWITLLAFKNAMTRGAKSIDKLSMTDMRAGVFVEHDGVSENGKPAAYITGTPSKFTCHVKNKQSADLRTRVLLRDWSYTLKFSVDTSMISVDQAVSSLVNAGVGCGVGDWRPEKSGVHGRWEVVGAQLVQAQIEDAAAAE